jgi:putative hydrolase of the HAD superfamily
MTRLDAVTFDFWNTIMWEGPDALVSSRIAALLGLVEEGGFDVEEAALRAAHQVAFERYQEQWRSGRQFCVPDAVAVMLHELGFEPSLELQRRMVRAFDSGGEAAVLHLADGVETCLETLFSAGVKLSIVCDIGLTPSPVLRKHLAERGLLRLFASWAFSDEVGCYKPDSRIFWWALDGLGGVDPAHAAHVGDRLRTDVAGARAMGMVSVRYRGIFDDDERCLPDADIVVSTYEGLPDLLFG